MEPFAGRFINITQPFIDFLEIFLFFSEDVGGQIETQVHSQFPQGLNFASVWFWRIYWQKWNITFFVRFSLVYNHLKLGDVVLTLPLNEPFISHSGRRSFSTGVAMLHCHISTVAENARTKHLLWREPMNFFCIFRNHCGFFYTLGRGGYSVDDNLIDATKTYTLLL